MAIDLPHGGDIEGYREQYGREPLDFSANCNPCGMPQRVCRAVCAAAAEADRYPDPLCRRLTAALAEQQGLPESWLLCGAGAADLIYRLALAVKPAAALVIAPCFAEYEPALVLAGAEMRRHPLSAADGFALTGRILEQIRPGLDLLFLTNPHNPTGLTIEPPLLLEIAGRCRDLGILLALDECFNGFVDRPGSHTLRHKLADYPNLIIFDAFTKLYGMAGLRLGYCLAADTDLLQSMRRAGPPWAVSSVAQAAGLAALAEQQYLCESRRLIRAERAFLQNELRRLGITAVSGEANFLFLHSPRSDLAARLREQGLLIRDCRNYAGLCPGYYRLSVRTHAENLLLLAALREIFASPDA